MQNHTPSPWHIEYDPTVDGDIWISSEAYCGLAIIQPLDDECTDEDRANARLIAMAPDMFAALTEIVAAEDGQCEVCRWGALTRARAVIEKAAAQWWFPDIEGSLQKVQTTAEPPANPFRVGTVDIVDLIFDLDSIGRRARETIDTGGREEFDPRDVEEIMSKATEVIETLVRKGSANEAG